MRGGRGQHGFVTARRRPGPPAIDESPPAYALQSLVVFYALKKAWNTRLGSFTHVVILPHLYKYMRNEDRRAARSWGVGRGWRLVGIDARCKCRARIYLFSPCYCYFPYSFASLRSVLVLPLPLPLVFCVVGVISMAPSPHSHCNL